MAQSAAQAVPSMTAPDGPRITIEGVRHVYRGGTVALDGVDLEIGQGLFGLLGPNGAGKSTLMRIVCTLLRPTAGRVRVCGHDVVGDRRSVRRVIGYLPQEFGAWRLQRVEEVLDTLGSLSGLSDAPARTARVERVLEQVGLEEVADRKVKALSDLALIDRGIVKFRGSPSQLVDRARGRVVRFTAAAAAEAPRLPAGAEVVSRTTEGGSAVFRVVLAEPRLPDGASPVSEVTLEEAYLAFMAAEGRTEAVTLESEEVAS